MDRLYVQNIFSPFKKKKKPSTYVYAYHIKLKYTRSMFILFSVKYLLFWKRIHSFYGVDIYLRIPLTLEVMHTLAQLAVNCSFFHPSLFFLLHKYLIHHTFVCI